MATVPGNRDDTQTLPFAPTQADLLIAAGIMHQQGKFQQMAGIAEDPPANLNISGAQKPHVSTSAQPRLMGPAANVNRPMDPSVQDFIDRLKDK